MSQTPDIDAEIERRIAPPPRHRAAMPPRRDDAQAKVRGLPTPALMPTVARSTGAMA